MGEDAENEKLVNKEDNKFNGEQQAKRRRRRPEDKLMKDERKVEDMVALESSLVV